MRVLWAITISAALAGCSTAGNTSLKDETQLSMSQKITKGKSTREEVRAALGDPTSSSFSDTGKEQWTYQLSTASPKLTNFIPYVNWIDSGSVGKNKSMVVLFDANGVVLNWTLNSSDVEVNYGLAPGALSSTAPGN